jgi:hypothetical protein
MLSIRTFSSLAFATLCLITGPAASRAADTTVSPLTLSVSRAVGADAVVLNGTSRASGPLEATLYATFSRDLPTVVLSRQNLAVGADGTFGATIPTAPAFFRDAIVTVIVRSLHDNVSATAHLSVAAPNVDTPADANPH